MTRMIKLFSFTIVLTFLLCSPSLASTLFETVAAPSAGMTLVALEGNYNGNAQAALNRINEIRYEACQEGIEDPRHPGTPLTLADYIPIQWSSSLEYIARVRAAESSILIGHTRPNGQSCFTVTSPDGTQTYGEVLAWNGENNMVSGIEQWYGEKYDWVNRTGRVTGHYTQMIDPDHLYVGLASFTNVKGIYFNTVSGEFDGYQTHNTTPAAPVQDCRVIIEIVSNVLDAPVIITRNTIARESGCLDKGDAVEYALAIPARLDGESFVVYDPGSISWTSGNPAVATVRPDGFAQVNGVGSATIQAVSTSGRSASTVLTAEHRFDPWYVAKQPNVFEEGTEERICAICDDKETRPIARLEPILQLSKPAATVKKTKATSASAHVASGDSITATSSNAKIVTVAVDGGTLHIQAGQKAGKAYVNVSTATGLSGRIEITVPKVKTKKVSCKKNVTVRKGKKVTLKPTVFPAYSDDKITYKSSNSKIATVSKKGVVKGKKKGKAYITIKSGSKSIKVKVTVK